MINPKFENLKYKILLKTSCLFVFPKMARQLYCKELKQRLKNNYWENLANINEIIEQKINEGYCIFLHDASLGDTLLFYEYKYAIEQVHGVKCFSIVKESHKVIPKLCNDKDYAVLNFQDIYKLPITKKLYKRAKKLFDIADIDSTIKKSRYFVAHPNYIRKLHSKIEKIPKDKRFFRKFEECLYDLPENTSYNDIINFGKVDVWGNFVYLAPESATVSLTKQISVEFWIAIAKYYKSKGFDVVYNAINEIKELSLYATWLNCDLESALYFALHSKLFISVRSGICDLLHSLGKRLVVVYPQEDLFVYSLQEMYNRSDIQEILYNDEMPVQEFFDKIQC